MRLTRCFQSDNNSKKADEATVNVKRTLEAQQGIKERADDRSEDQPDSHRCFNVANEHLLVVREVTRGHQVARCLHQGRRRPLHEPYSERDRQHKIRVLDSGHQSEKDKAEAHLDEPKSDEFLVAAP